MTPTQEMLKRLLEYRPETGLFFWRSPTPDSVRCWRRAGHTDRQGVMRITVAGENCKASDLVQIYLHGDQPAPDPWEIEKAKAKARNDAYYASLKSPKK